jgi:hypothetical protein
MTLRRASSQPSTIVEGFYQGLASSTDSVTTSLGRNVIPVSHAHAYRGLCPIQRVGLNVSRALVVVGG